MKKFNKVFKNTQDLEKFLEVVYLQDLDELSKNIKFVYYKETELKKNGEPKTGATILCVEKLTNGLYLAYLSYYNVEDSTTYLLTSNKAYAIKWVNIAYEYSKKGRLYDIE